MTTYVVMRNGREVGKYGFTRALMEVRQIRAEDEQAVIQVFNSDRCDGATDGWDDGLTQEERDMLWEET